MFTRYSPRVFVSYSHEDKEALWQFVDLAREGNVDPVHDRRCVEPSDQLDLRVRRMIDGSDCVVCLGTERSFASAWCRQEVEYALEYSKVYYPVILDDTSLDAAPPWFRGELRPHHLGVNVAQGRDGMALALRLIARNHSGLRAWCSVALGLLLLLATPLVLGHGALTLATMAGPVAHRWQAEIESVNAAIQYATPAVDGSTSAIVYSQSSDEDGVRQYRDRSTGQLVARDAIVAGNLARREYLRDNQVIAIDSFAKCATPGGHPYVLKTREIHVPGAGGMVVEDIFDSVGNLIGKRVKVGETGSWRHYADTGYSIYPALLGGYR